MKKFPGRGGGKECAKAFGVSPQQWSPWERAVRTPNESRLAEIAKFFNVTVEWLRRDHPKPPPSGIGDFDLPFPPPDEHAPPGSAASFFHLVRHIASCLGKEGITIRLQLDRQLLEQLADILKTP